MEDLISQRNSPLRANYNESAFDQHSMPWLTGSADKRITDDPQLSEVSGSDEEDEFDSPDHRITRVRHHKILKRVRQKLQRY